MTPFTNLVGRGGFEPPFQSDFDCVFATIRPPRNQTLPPGLEPGTVPLTAESSTTELKQNKKTHGVGIEPTHS